MKQTTTTRYIVTLATTDRDDADYIPTLVLHTPDGRNIVDTIDECADIIKYELDELLLTEDKLVFSTNLTEKQSSCTKKTLDKRLISQIRTGKIGYLQLHRAYGTEDVYTISVVR